MALSLSEYLENLHQRPDLLWPKPPPLNPLKATPSCQPIPGIKLVTWSIYGALLHIDEGRLMHLHPQEFRMQIALEKTIKEFNMWNSMSRKPGQPWEYMLRQYKTILEEAGMVSTRRKGDVPELDSRKIWRKIIERLVKNEYAWEESTLGDLDEFAAKVACFFHACLQGTEALPGARDTLLQLMHSGIRCGLLTDAQVFSMPQLLHDFRQQGPIGSLADILSPDLLLLSSQVGLKKPSETLYQQARQQFEQRQISPEQVLHVSHRLQDDLAVAKKYGFHTVLFAADKNSCRVQAADVRNPDWKPDRLITEIRQIRDIVGV
jgi:FMN phosphatase YigB (HAD superfamily)